jgi:hypothetical protein
VKLEKERRLRCQELYLRADVEALNEVLAAYSVVKFEAALKSNRIGGYPIAELPRIARKGPKEAVERVREAFVSVALQCALRETREMLSNELESVAERLASYNDFQSRRSNLLAQRKSTLELLGVEADEFAGEVLEDFEKIEGRWNQVSEDLVNVETAVGHLQNNLDFLRSARSFVLGARASFDVDVWCRSGYLSDLFRHSPIGRVFEMVQCADLNVRLAEKELVCLTCWQYQAHKSVTVLGPFVHTLFDDLFVRGNFQTTKAVIEEAEEKNRREHEALAKFCQKLTDERCELDRQREEKFTEMGHNVKRFVCN